MKKTLLLTTVLLLSVLCKAQTQKIQLNLAKGETYSQKSDCNLDISQEFGGQQIVIKMKVFGKMNYKVMSIVDTVYDMNVSYESLGLKMDIQGNSITYSSENPKDNDIMSKIMQAMTTKSFAVKMSKRGQIIEVKHIDQLFEAFNAFTALTDAQRQQLKAQVAESYGEKAFKGNLEMSLAIFPSREVAKGESWVTRTSLQSKMSIDVENTFTLKEITDTYYIIGCASKLTPDSKAGFVDVNGMTMKYNLSGTMTGELKIDKKTGWTIGASFEQHLSGVNTIKPGDRIPNGMDVPMKMSNKLIFTSN